MTTIDQISNHLQFLGYDISRDGEIIKAKHHTKCNMALKEFRGGTLFTAIYGCSEYSLRNRMEYLDFINTMNNKASIARFYADKDSDLFIEGWYPNYYERAEFGGFLEMWDRDTEALLIQNDAAKFLK